MKSLFKFESKAGVQFYIFPDIYLICSIEK